MKIRSFNDFVQNYKLKNKATSNKKIQQVFSSLTLNDIKIYLKDDPFSGEIEIVHLHSSKRTHWVVYNNEG